MDFDKRCGILSRMKNQTELELMLNDFDANIRSQALENLWRNFKHVLEPEGENVNMHMHSFFSYNAEGWSPSRIAWEAKKQGLRAAALCDFDVLEGVEEFLHACGIVELRGSVGLETRAFLKEFSTVDINSPGEPGVTYIMGMGFVSKPDSGSSAYDELQSFRQQYDERNLRMIEKINKALPDIALDYQKDAVPLTPAGGVTERHIICAYRVKSESVFPDVDKRALFWSDILGVEVSTVGQWLLEDIPTLEEKIRSKCAKKGGVGYEPPSESTFPPVEQFISWVQSCNAIPMITWLDGTSQGEADPQRMLGLLSEKGAVALNIIPDRNWNIADKAAQDVKVANLHAVVGEAVRMGLPINIGTEMNKLGLPFADDLNGPVLKEFKEAFQQGADVMNGHTLLLRYADFSYISADANTMFANVHEKNQFFANMGRQPALALEETSHLEELGKERAFDALIDRQKK